MVGSAIASARNIVQQQDRALERSMVAVRAFSGVGCRYAWNRCDASHFAVAAPIQGGFRDGVFHALVLRELYEGRSRESGQLLPGAGGSRESDQPGTRS